MPFSGNILWFIEIYFKLFLPMPEHLVVMEFENWNITSGIIDFSQFLVCPGQLNLLSSKKIKIILKVLIVFMEEIKQFDVKNH